MRRVIAAGVALGVAAVLFGGSPAAAAEPLKITIAFDGKDITGNTVTVEPSKPVELTVTATNQSDAVVKVRSVRLSGVALALTFFSYDTVVPYDIPARQTVTRTLVLDLAELEGQAIGLLPATVEVLDIQREVIGSSKTVTDVRGSLWSVYGVFGLALLVLTAFIWTTALIALARHKLSPNRWNRALRFLPAGIGTGLVAVVSLSVLRLVPPEPTVEIPIVIAAAAIGLVLGYLTPHPLPPPPPPLGGPDDPTIGMTTRRMDSTTEAYG
ncbi:hypothetical protein [Kibdelosporangium aridum]|uniref:DUF4436 domain-containing protein n=1 Tax=Kibdelosporangium aridum TaxID=2030 RepID=A0A1W2F875_KIBAR|nr:hypothetical protein [Kibdelosporangium aridum]SMD18141.1 hypothetical protein SAMN05661093_05703 [Kibdelosporangium aridum]